jgi:hypothetical protein
VTQPNPNGKPNPNGNTWKHMQIGLLPLWHQDAKKGDNNTRSLLKVIKVLIIISMVIIFFIFIAISIFFLIFFINGFLALGGDFG